MFNVSSIELTDPMYKVLNRGLNFAVLPDKLDITKALVEWKRCGRTLTWKEWWYGRDREESYKEPIFKTKKSNLPKNHKVPNGLNTFINSVVKN